MSTIKIQPDTVRQESGRFSQAAADLTNIYWSINRISNQLDWEIRSKGQVESRINSAASLGKKLYEEASVMSDYLKNCASALEQADAQGQQNIGGLATIGVGSNTPIIIGGAMGGGLLAGLIAGGKSFRTTALGWIKGIFGWGNQSSSTENTITDNYVDINVPAGVRLSELMQTDGFKKGQVSKTGGQCNGFASAVFKKMFGIDIAHRQIKDSKGNYISSEYYKLDIKPNDNISIVQQKVSDGTMAGNDVSNLFKDAHVGDFIQMKWLKDGSPHSAIISGITKDASGKVTGFEFYDANMGATKENPAVNDIRIHSYTVDKYASLISQKGNGFTIYTPKDGSATQTILQTSVF